MTGWLAAQPDSWREQVTHVAIDLSASYAKAVRDALPDAVLVADKFHLVALGQPDAHRGAPARHPAGPRPPGPQEGPRVGRPPAAAARLTSASPATRSPGSGTRWSTPVSRAPRCCTRTPSRSDCAPCSRWARTRTVRPSRTGCTGSTPRPPPATCPRPTASPRPSRPGGRPIARRDHHRLHQRPLRGLQPPRQARRTGRLRLPQPGQPETPDTVGLHPPTPAGVSHDSPHTARLSSMSPFEDLRHFAAYRPVAPWPRVLITEERSRNSSPHSPRQVELMITRRAPLRRRQSAL